MLTAKKENALIWTLMLIQFTHFMDFVIISPLSDVLMKELHITTKEFGIVLASYTFSAAIFGGGLGVLFINKFDRKLVLQVLYIGLTLSTFACGFSDSYLSLIVCRVLAGGFGGAISSILMAIVGDAIPVERRGAAIGKIMSAFAFASIVGVPSGLIIAETWGWNAAFYLVAILCVAVYFLILAFVPSLKKHLEFKESQSFMVIANEIFNYRSPVLSLVLMTCLMMGSFILIPFIAPYMISNVGFEQTDLKYIYFCGGIGSMLSAVVIGKLCDIFGASKVFRIACFLSLIPLWIISNLPPVSLAVALVATTLFFILNGARMIPAINLINTTVKPQYRGSFISISTFFQNMASGIASYLGGLIITKDASGLIQNYPMAGYFSILFSVIALLVTFGITPFEKIKEE